MYFYTFIVFFFFLFGLPIDRTLTGATTPVQDRPGNNSNSSSTLVYLKRNCNKFTLGYVNAAKYITSKNIQEGSRKLRK